jgi:peptidoglycan/xylan/chitin deacetylase (PgdA/CDA1 family)
MRLGPPLLYVATAGGFAMTTRAVLGHPIPLPYAAAYLGGYLALLAVGSMSPGLAMWGETLTSVADGRGVALTFDDGPHPVHTRKVAEILERFGARATFFQIGEKVAAHPDVSRELVERGHEVGVHGHRVDRFLGFRARAAVHGDFERARDTIAKATGARPLLFRPPYGVVNPTILRATNDLDLDVIGWSVRALDGIARTRPEAIVTRVSAGLRDGAIVCMHDAAEIGERVPAAIEALPEILSQMDARGLRGVTVSQLIASAVQP